VITATNIRGNFY